MYNSIYYSRKKLQDEEKAQLPLEDIKFNGFDANDSEEIKYKAFAEFLIDDYDCWTEFKKNSLVEGDFNSHGFGPNVPRLKKMIKEYKSLNKHGESLSLEDIKKVLNTR